MPHSQILMTGGSDRGSYFIPKRLKNLRSLSTQKYHYFFSIPKKTLSPFFAMQKNPSIFFFTTQKNPCIFHRPKTITFGQNFRPKKNHSDPPPSSLKYVSRSPGHANCVLPMKVQFFGNKVTIFAKILTTLQWVLQFCKLQSLDVVFSLYSVFNSNIKEFWKFENPRWWPLLTSFIWFWLPWKSIRHHVDTINWKYKESSLHVPNIKSIGLMVSKVEGRGWLTPPPSPLCLCVTFLGLCLLGLRRPFLMVQTDDHLVSKTLVSPDVSYFVFYWDVFSKI